MDIMERPGIIQWDYFRPIQMEDIVPEVVPNAAVKVLHFYLIYTTVTSFDAKFLQYIVGKCTVNYILIFF